MSVRKKEIAVEVLRSTEYERFKRVLNRGRHPTFVGRSTFTRFAREGGGAAYVIDGEDAAVSLVKPSTNTLMVLNVDPRFRGVGVGSFAIRYLAVNWVRALESATPFFERHGYRAVGEPIEGKKLYTIVMVRHDICDLAGRLRKIREGQ